MIKFKLHILKPDGEVSSHDYDKKPTFQDIYPLVGCTMLQPSTAYLPKYSNRKDGYAEFYMDEEGGPMIIGEYDKKKNPKGAIVNKNVTSAWYNWQEKTGHQSLPGTKIHGNVAVIHKLEP